MPVTGHNTYTGKQEEASWNFLYCQECGGWRVFNHVRSLGIFECWECSQKYGSENSE